MKQFRTLWTWKDKYDKEWEEKLFGTREAAIEDAKLNVCWFEIETVCIGKCEMRGTSVINGYEVTEVEQIKIDIDNEIEYDYGGE